MNWSFRILAVRTAELVGSAYTFTLAVFLVGFWAMTGPHFHWSEGHQLFINTVTTIITFLVVFLIQNTQNRDTRSLHLKVDELLKATRGARNSMIDLDRLTDEQLRALEVEFKKICAIDLATMTSEELDTRPAQLPDHVST